jgi:hypothetical protein
LITCRTNNAEIIEAASTLVIPRSDVNHPPVRSTVVVSAIADHIQSHKVLAASPKDWAIASKPVEATLLTAPPIVSQTNCRRTARHD